VRILVVMMKQVMIVGVLPLIDGLGNEACAGEVS